MATTPKPSNESTPAREAVPKKSRWGCFLRAFGLALLVLLLIYPVVGNLLLKTERGRNLILPRNDRLEIVWSSAYTILPGIVHLEGFHLAHQARRLDWQIDIDQARINIWLPSLLRKKLAVRSIGGYGFSCQFDRVGEPRVFEKKTRNRPWTLAFSGIELQGFRHCRMGGHELQPAEQDGEATVRGSVEFKIRGDMKLDSDLEISTLALVRDGRRVAFVDQFDLALRSDAFAPREVKGRQLLRHVSGELTLDTETSSLGFLNAYLSKADWLDLTAGTGRLQADLSVDRGVLGSASRLHFLSEDLRLRYLDWQALGKSEFIGQVEAERPRFAAAFQEFEVGPKDAEVGHITGRELTVSMDLSTNDLAETPDVDLVLDLPESDVADLSSYDDFLPPGAGIEIVAGSGRASAHLELSTLNDHGEGTMTLSSDNLEARSGGLELAGQIRLAAVLDEADLEQRTFALDGTRLELNGLSLRQEGELVQEDWAGAIELADGRLRLERPLTGQSHLQFEMTDARPILAFFAERKPKLDTVARLLKVRDIEGSTDLGLSNETMVVDALELEANRLKLEGRLCLGKGSRNGALHARTFGVGAAAWFEDSDRRWTLLRPRRWYEEKLAEVDCQLDQGQDEPGSVVPETATEAAAQAPPDESQ